MSQSGKVTDAAGGGGADTFETDSGTAVEVAGVINILGTAPLTTSGAGNTVTILDDGTIPTDFLTDSGSANPSSNAIAMSGGTGLNTTGAGAVVTTNLDSPVIVENGGSERTSATAFSVICGGTTSTDPHQSVASVGTANQILTSNGAGSLPTFQDGTSLDDLEFAASDGSAFPSSDIINITGSNGIGTAGAGNTVDISLNTPILVSDSGSGRTSATAFSVICGGTTSTSAHQSVASVGTAAQVLTSNGAGSLPTFQDAGGGGTGVQQQVYASSSATSSTGVDIPLDGTIPQITEGEEIVNVSITPSDVNNILIIEAQAFLNVDSNNSQATLAIFQDAIADGLYAQGSNMASGIGSSIYIQFRMAAGTTSATTFRLRYGPDGDTAFLNRKNTGATDNYGGITLSWLQVTELAL